ncbi:alpha/beta hydrolase [Lentibacillus sediminis]|uniref:alpha/beta hydrolase n=1 Tax=Lentibacillus sediminis TaxID=1940529 RepID=UPI000C1B8869|nr:alpha/beta hydrolase family protein [Lentibacillus sediminis]
MARIECEFFSEVLVKNMTMSVILPQKGKFYPESESAADRYPTLFLLHGFSDNHMTWLQNTSLERYAADYRLAIVMPSADNSYYNDMANGSKYWTYLTEEIPAAARSFFPLSEKREDNFVAGHSMGGFGALKWGLNYPEQFAAVASLSGVTDMVFHLERARPFAADKYKSLSLAFGEETIIHTANDILWLLEQTDRLHEKKPMLYQACGTEDFLHEHNMRFFRTCKKTGVDLTTNFGPGEHSWDYWDDQIREVLQWLRINVNPKV